MFEILPSGVPSFYSYIGVQDVRAAGMSATVASDSKVIGAILTWQEIVERLCRQWFSPRYITFRFNGDDSDLARFNTPIIAVESLYINDDTAALTPDLYEVYGGKDAAGDNRRNPRIALREWGGTIFTMDENQGRVKFLRGRKNQTVSGWFGYVEDENLTPGPIQRALLMLVLEKLSTPLYSDPSSPSPMPIPPVLGPVVEEWTDGHRLKYAEVGGSSGTRKTGMSGLTSNPEIIDTLLLYRGPIGIAVPADWWR
jgi:hypothetical protein